jgi:hypothetical protein
MYNTVADAISQLDYNPKVKLTSKFNYSTFGIPAKGETITKWKAFSKLWRCYNKNNPGNETQDCNLNKVFASHSKEEQIFPLTTPEIAETQQADIKLKHCFRHNTVLDKGLEVRLIDNTTGVLGWKNNNSKATPKVCSVMVPPLSAAPRTHST